MLRRLDVLLPVVGAACLLLGLALVALALGLDPASGDFPRRYATYEPLRPAPPSWIAPTGWTVAGCGLLLVLLWSAVLLVQRVRQREQPGRPRRWSAQ